jgi:ABC-type lipoprotein release transport system permease subunit
MINKNLLNFATLSFYKNRTKNLPITFILTILVFITYSFIFVSDSLKQTTSNLLYENQDFIIQKMSSGKNIDTPLEWIDEYININGIDQVTPRVYGKYWYEMNENYFTIVGIDFFEENNHKLLQNILKDIDVNKFLEKNNMIVSNGVKEFLDYYEYKKYYTFRNPKREVKRVYIKGYIPQELGVIANDLIIMDINLARQILGIDEEKCTDIIVNVKNPLEKENIKYELIKKHFDSRIIDTKDIQNQINSLFDYKNRVFIIIFTLVLITFLIILYQRYSFISHDERDKIIILKSVGFSINDIIIFKLLENFLILFSSLLIGIALAYIYVFLFDAKFILEIFLGFDNLQLNIQLIPYISFYNLITIFLLFFIPFLLSIIIPIWKLSTKN